MPIVLTLDHHAGGARQTRTLQGGTLSVGRGRGNEGVLAAPDGHLSKTHCMISLEGGRTYLTDLSTNGMFVNGAREATRRDSRLELTDGDSFRLGDYLISVATLPDAVARPSGPAMGTEPDPLGGDLLDDPFGEPSPAAARFAHPMPQAAPALRVADPFDALDEGHRHAALLDDDFFKGAEPADPWAGPSQPDNVDAPFHALAAPRTVSAPAFDELDIDALLGDTPPGETADPFAPVAPPEPVAARPAPRPATAAPAPPPADPAPSTSGGAAGLAAFLDGAGMAELRGLGDADDTLRAAGAVFRALVEGLREVLMSRSAIKNELRVEQTMMRARGNNALKFSVTPEEALAALLLPERTGYKPAIDSAREAFADVRSHEMAVMAGMQTALLSLLRRFDPAALEQRLQAGRLDAILPAARKARTWELFCLTYRELAREAEDDFQSVFGREFARAYEAQMKKL